MPNWCYNELSLSHEDPAMEERVRKAIWENNFFNEFVPFPEDIGDNWREWNNEHWGTKWETDFDDYLENMEMENDEDIDLLNLYFNTAWSPPIEFYEALTKLGFDVFATYREPGCELAGGFENGDHFCSEIITSDNEDEDEDEEEDYDVDDVDEDDDVDTMIAKIMERLDQIERLVLP